MLGPPEGAQNPFTQREIKDALWDAYFDVESVLDTLTKEAEKRNRKKQGELRDAVAPDLPASSRRCPEHCLLHGRRRPKPLPSPTPEEQERQQLTTTTSAAALACLLLLPVTSATQNRLPLPHRASAQTYRTSPSLRRPHYPCAAEVDDPVEASAVLLGVVEA